MTGYLFFDIFLHRKRNEVRKHDHTQTTVLRCQFVHRKISTLTFGTNHVYVWNLTVRTQYYIHWSVNGRNTKNTHYWGKHACSNSMFQIMSFLQESSNITSYCDQTFPSWSHDVTLRHWACFYGRKQNPFPPKVHRDPFHGVTEVLRTSYASCIETAAIKTNPKYTSFKLSTHLPSQTTYVTNAMKQNPSREANRSSAIQEISCIL